MDERILISGENSIVLEFGNEISEEINQKLRAFSYIIEKRNEDFIIELIPTYRSIRIEYDCQMKNFKEISDYILSIKDQIKLVDIPSAKIVEIPTMYGGEFGPDLESVASFNKLSKEEVIRIHSSKEYLVYMIGFTPGFPYLGGMDERIAMPRLSSPRVKISAGSVGIADKQTGIYPIDSPGGWQLVGKTPFKLYDPDRTENPIMISSGDYIKFVSIDEDEYYKIKDLIKANKYSLKVYDKEAI